MRESVGVIVQLEPPVPAAENCSVSPLVTETVAGDPDGTVTKPPPFLEYCPVSAPALVMTIDAVPAGTVSVLVADMATEEPTFEPQLLATVTDE